MTHTQKKTLTEDLIDALINSDIKEHPGDVSGESPPPLSVHSSPSQDASIEAPPNDSDNGDKTIDLRALKNNPLMTSIKDSLSDPKNPSFEQNNDLPKSSPLLSQTTTLAPLEFIPPKSRQKDRTHHTQLNPSDSSLGFPSSNDAILVQAENLRVAQQYIVDLEEVIERLRRDNEALLAAGEVIGKRLEDQQAKNEQLQNAQKNQSENLINEVTILKDTLRFKEKQSQQFKDKIQELEGRLAGDLKKIRIRERELENRLEMIKVEYATLVRSKDQSILDLKRQIDKMSVEVENYRNKCQDLSQHIASQEERIRRTVKALRLALNQLEGPTDPRG